MRVCRYIGTTEKAGFALQEAFKRLNVIVETDLIVRAVALGVGATIVMDLWAVMLKRVFAIPSLDYRVVGRWILHMSQGKFKHNNIMQAEPMIGEKAIGWIVHYATGVLFAGILLLCTGIGWAQQPTFWPALLAGLLSMAAPFFIMQPCFGFGIAASKTPAPGTARFRSLMAHSVFGVGLYLAALVISSFM